MFKRVLDLALVILIFPVAFPVMLVLMVLVASDGSSPFYAQTRVGRHGRMFYCYKFRSMVPDAPERLAAVLAADPAAAAEWAFNRKLTNDPRITRFGRFIRATSLDELPQLWNVLRGDMSIVGPRPVTEEEIELHYGRAARRLLSVRPGVTGLWQVSGRSDAVPYDERVRMDMAYVQSITLLRDASIVLRTLLVMVKRAGN
ncbi:sugar transferase [Roseisalinus antarcticus]|uniref:sugar transferase n=1 Tax=Roseisalinus antarcticus TaxID=254357 RepID=UPI00135641FC|nr:sugar transferase [Roseisalinus antarcticus]